MEAYWLKHEHNTLQPGIREYLKASQKYIYHVEEDRRQRFAGWFSFSFLDNLKFIKMLLKTVRIER